MRLTRTKTYYVPHDSMYRYDDIKLRDYIEYSATLTGRRDATIYLAI